MEMGEKGGEARSGKDEKELYEEKGEKGGEMIESFKAKYVGVGDEDRYERLKQDCFS